MAESTQQSTAVLLAKIRQGDAAALDQLFAEVYAELKRIAIRTARCGPAAPTIQPTALINEVYLRMAKAERLDIENRRHFLAVAARAMRQFLVSYARKKRSRKRGGHVDPGITLSEKDLIDVRQSPIDVLELSELLDGLAEFAARPATVVELRVFGGMTFQEVAGLLDKSETTVRTDFNVARGWLRQELTRDS